MCETRRRKRRRTRWRNGCISQSILDHSTLISNSRDQQRTLWLLNSLENNLTIAYPSNTLCKSLSTYQAISTMNLFKQLNYANSEKVCPTPSFTYCLSTLFEIQWTTLNYFAYSLHSFAGQSLFPSVWTFLFSCRYLSSPVSWLFYMIIIYTASIKNCFESMLHS